MDEPVDAQPGAVVRTRLSLRWRLALLYGGLQAVVGAALLVLTLWLVDRSVTASAAAPEGGLVQVTSGGEDTVVRAEDLVALLRAQAREAVLTVGAPLYALVVLAGAAVGYAVAARALQPVAALTATAARLAATALAPSALAERIALPGPRDELYRLAATFDAMLTRLDRTFDAQRRFVANASHELRTPLAVVRTEVDVALADPAADAADLRAMGQRVVTATERAEALVESLLVLARSEAQAGTGVDVRVEVDLAAAVPPALAALAGEIAAAGLRTDCDLRPARTAGDPELLERMVGNLAENAVRHNVGGGWLRITTREDTGFAALMVDNSGPPLDPTRAGELLAPFRRGGTTRRGAGLGLSIVSAVAAAHGGNLRIEPRAGGGLHVEVRLPTA